MTTIDKSCLITQLPVPEVISDIIKSFAFYNIEETTKNNKVKKDKIVIDCINNGVFSNDDIHWTKELYLVEFNDNNAMIRNNSILQMQSVNCNVCGNYWHCELSHIRCKCHENEEIYDDDTDDEDDDRRNNYDYFDDDDEYVMGGFW
jgi:hypothetical protein